MTKWVTVAQAADMLDMSERSVRRHVADGRLESRLEGNRRLVMVDPDSDNVVTTGMTVTDRGAMIKWLQSELEERNKQIERLQEEIRQNQARADAIVMRLADELEAQRNILEGILEGRTVPKRKRDESLWQRLRRSGNDMEE